MEQTEFSFVLHERCPYNKRYNKFGGVDLSPILFNVGSVFETKCEVAPSGDLVFEIVFKPIYPVKYVIADFIVEK